MNLERLHTLFLAGFCCLMPNLGSAPSHAEEKAGAGVVSVGIILPLTGEFAAWSQSIRRSFELIEPQFKNRLSFVFEDEGNCEPLRTVNAFQKLISTQTRFVFVGCLAGTKAILPIANRNNVLLLSLGLVDDAAFQQTTKLVNLATQLSTESAYLARHVLNRKHKAVAIVHWEDAFSNEFARTLKAALERGGAGPIGDYPVQSNDNDFRSTVLRIKKEKPDAICSNVGEQQSGVLLRQIRQNGIDSPFFANYPFEAQPTLASGGAYANGVEYSFPLNSAENSPDKTVFDSAFAAKFGKDAVPNPNAYFARDGVVLLDKALAQCGGAEPECVSKYFRALSKFEGISGTVSFMADGSNVRPYGIKTVRGGNFEWLNKDLKLE